MALPAGVTGIADLFDPEVVGDLIDKKLIDAIRFTRLAMVDDTLEGQPGSKVKLPSFNYIGKAEKVAEDEDLPIKKLTQTEEEVEIMEYGLAVEITDRGAIIGFGDPLDEAARQITVAIADGVEDSLINAASTTASLIGTSTATKVTDRIADDLELFGEEIDGEKVLVVPPKVHTALRKSSDWIPNTQMGADIIVRGTVGMIYGCQIVTSNRLTAKNEGFIIKPGALAIISKRNTLVEYDRDILGRKNLITGSKMFAPYIYDKSKLIKISFGGASAGA